MMMIWMARAMTTTVIIAYILKKEVCGLANFPRTCRDQIFRVFILLPHFASRNRVESPRFAHQVGRASDLHDPRSPPTCQMTHMILANPLQTASASATPGQKTPNKGWGRTFMDVPSTPTKSGNEWLTHPKALGFYFGPHVLTRTDPNPAHRSN